MQKTVQIYSKPDNLRIIENIIDDISSETKLATDIYGKVLIATVEAVNNAIIHGNKSDDKKRVFIKFMSNDKVLKIRIEDEGEGFDYTNIPDPTSPENLENIHGRGVFLMSKLSDDINFENEGSLVELVFKL
ncbi:MAG: ATP-binding protein [Chlorobi bacterium]|nr:ATP-binding protein [Chlorobiota bacterium]